MPDRFSSAKEKCVLVEYLSRCLKLVVLFSRVSKAVPSMAHPSQGTLHRHTQTHTTHKDRVYILRFLLPAPFNERQVCTSWWLGGSGISRSPPYRLQLYDWHRFVPAIAGLKIRFARCGNRRRGRGRTPRASGECRDPSFARGYEPPATPPTKNHRCLVGGSKCRGRNIRKRCPRSTARYHRVIYPRP